MPPSPLGCPVAPPGPKPRARGGSRSVLSSGCGGREAESRTRRFLSSLSSCGPVPSRLRAEIRLFSASPFPRTASASFLCLHPQSQPCLSGAGLGALGRPGLWMWLPDDSTAPLRMDSRHTSSAGLGGLTQLSAAIPATRVEVSVSCR